MSDIPIDPEPNGGVEPRHGLQSVIWFADDATRRGIDVIGALCFIIIFAPIFCLLALIVATDGGPVFFSHQRIGRNGVSFGCYKFRTMVVGAEECLAEYLRYHPEVVEQWDRDQKLEADPRITPIGAWLRKTSLDEIPQMWNVILGHMSLVGPRPVTEAEMRGRYRQFSALVTSVRPGVTGLWQVSGRNELNYEKRVQMDVAYVRGRTLAVDLGILLRTFPVVFGRTGAR